MDILGRSQWAVQADLLLWAGRKKRWEKKSEKKKIGIAINEIGELMLEIDWDCPLRLSLIEKKALR